MMTKHSNEVCGLSDCWSSQNCLDPDSLSSFISHEALALQYFLFPISIKFLCVLSTTSIFTWTSLNGFLSTNCFTTTKPGLFNKKLNSMEILMITRFRNRSNKYKWGGKLCLQEIKVRWLWAAGTGRREWHLSRKLDSRKQAVWGILQNWSRRT